MVKSLQTLKLIAVLLVLLIAVFFAGFFTGRFSGTDAEPVAAESTSFDLQLPGEVEKRIVTEDEVKDKLVEIGELAAYSGEYTVSKSAEYTRHFLDDIRVPGTTNAVGITCSGLVKVGYDIASIGIDVDSEHQIIHIALPKAQLLDNYVIWDTMEISEKNNILNPIDADQYQALITEIEAEGLAQVENDGIYDACEENVKVLITNFLAGFEGYEIKFMTTG